MVFETRAALVRTIRSFLEARGFLDVETPMMHHIPGGATARPFKTHHNALDIDLYLRIAPELFLKRLLVGGIPRVYEINRNFRNEGISTRHNPEFTMLEFYWAYADYRQMMDFTEELLSAVAEVAKQVQGKDAITWEGRPIDFSRPWKRITLRDAIKEKTGIDILAGDELPGEGTWAKRVDALLSHASLALAATGNIVLASILGSIGAAVACERQGNVPVGLPEVEQKLQHLERRARYEVGSHA